MNSEIKHPFDVRENRLTDGSIIWEIYQDGSAQRLASAATKGEAEELEMALNLAVTDWSERTVQNTVDC
jgi:hypothetical protein